MIEIDAPDGSVAEFPDGTPPDVIKRAMAKAFPKKIGIPDAITEGAGNASWFGFDDEAYGGVKALQAMATGGDGGETYQRERAWKNKQKERSMADRPVSYVGGNVAASVAAPGPALAKLPFLPRMVAASGVGGVQGAAAGFGSGEGLEDRVEKAKQGAGIGAAMGPAAVAAGKVVEPIARKAIGAGRQVIRNATKPMDYKAPVPDSMVVLGPPIGRKPPNPGTQPPAKPKFDKQVIKLAERAGGAPAVKEAVEPYRAGGRQPLLAQGIGKPGIRRLDTLAGSPGKTQAAAEKTIKGRRAGQYGRIEKATDEAFGDETRSAARAAAKDKFSMMSPEYEDMLGKAVIPKEKASVIAKAWGDIPEAEQAKALAKAKAIAAYDGGFEKMNTARQAHYIKMAIGERIDDMAREGTAGVQRRKLTLALKEYRAALEEAIPGYKDLNARWADNVQTEEAISWADDLFAGGKRAMDDEEAKAAFSAMSPAQKQAALVSVRGRVLQGFSERAKTGQRQTNIAGPELDDTFEKRMRVVLGEKAEPFLKALKAEDLDFDTLSKVGGGSQTFERGMDALDQAIPSKTKIANDLIKMLVNPKMEADRDKLGAQLLEELTPEMEGELIRLLSNRQAAREAARAASIKAGGGAARVGASQD